MPLVMVFGIINIPKESVVVPVINALSDAERRVNVYKLHSKLLSFSLTIPFICAKVQSESIKNFIINMLRILLLVFIISFVFCFIWQRYFLCKYHLLHFCVNLLLSLFFTLLCILFAVFHIKNVLL